MTMKTLTGKAIALTAPLLFLLPLLYAADGTRGILVKVAVASMFIYMFWFMYVVGWRYCIGLLIIGFAVDGLRKGDYDQVTGALLSPFIVGLAVLGAMKNDWNKTPGQRLDEQIQAEMDASNEAHRLETERMDQDFFDSHQRQSDKD